MLWAVSRSMLSHLPLVRVNARLYDARQASNEMRIATIGWHSRRVHVRGRTYLCVTPVGVIHTILPLPGPAFMYPSEALPSLSRPCEWNTMGGLCADRA